MKRASKRSFKKTTAHLAANHNWKAPDGYKIVVIDRGAASFNIPHNWVVTELEPFTVRDKMPPDDKAGLQVTIWHMPPNVDWSGLPLAPLLLSAIKDSAHEVLARGQLVTSPRTDLELVWIEDRFVDPIEKREAFSRYCSARGWDVQILMTFSYWVEDQAEGVPIWDEALRSLQLGRHIEDPTKGIVMQ
jgi:hypothetical protein